MKTKVIEMGAFQIVGDGCVVFNEDGVSYVIPECLERPDGQERRMIADLAREVARQKEEIRKRCPQEMLKTISVQAATIRELQAEKGLVRPKPRKVVVIKVCGDCPKFNQAMGVCSAKYREQIGGGSLGNILDPGTIPSWCPLEDAE